MAKTRKIELSAEFKSAMAAALLEFDESVAAAERAEQRRRDKLRYKPTLGEDVLSLQCLQLSICSHVDAMKVQMLFELVRVLYEQLGIELDVPRLSGEGGSPANIINEIKENIN